MAEHPETRDAWAHFAKGLEDELADNQKWLDRFESGQMSLRERPEGSGWVDVTPEEIGKRKAIKASLEGVLEKVQERIYTENAKRVFAEIESSEPNLLKRLDLVDLKARDIVLGRRGSAG